MKTPWTYEANGHAITVDIRYYGMGGGSCYFMQCTCGAHGQSEEVYMNDPYQMYQALNEEYRKKYAHGWDATKFWTYEALVGQSLAHVGYGQKESDADTLLIAQQGAKWKNPHDWEVLTGIATYPYKDSEDLIDSLKEKVAILTAQLDEAGQLVAAASDRVRIFEGMKKGIHFDEAWRNFRADD